MRYAASSYLVEVGRSFREPESERMGFAPRLRYSNRVADYIPSFDAEMLRCSQQMGVIRIYDAELRFSCRGKVNGIGCAQKHRSWQLLIDVPDS